MKEVEQHPIYELIEKYRNDLSVQYVLLYPENTCNASHRQAAIEGMILLTSEPFDTTKMEAEEYPVSLFFKEPEYHYTEHPKFGKSKGVIGDERKCYWYAFLEPPYPNNLTAEDWRQFNSILFSKPENLEIYQWNTSWADFFKMGLDWWGAFYWTIYDKEQEMYIVVAASDTD